MNAFEKNLLTGIPQDEAASYFLRVTGRDKVAQANLEAAWNELTEGEQDEILKEAAAEGFLDEKLANAMGMSMGAAKPGPPPAPAGMAAPSPQALPPTAQGMNSVKTALERGSWDDPIQQIAAISALAHTAHAALTGKSTFGPLMSGVGGFASGEAGARAGAERDTPMGAALAGGLSSAVPAMVLSSRPGAHILGGAAAGVAGHYAGKKDREEKHKKQQEKDEKKKQTAERMKKAAARLKIAFDGGDSTMAAPSAGGGLDDDGDPTLEEYLRQEALGGQAEEQGGSEFYRQRLQNAMQELEATKAQAEQVSAQAEQLQQQVAQNDETVQASMQQAQMAQQTAMQNVQQAHEMAMQATNQAMESQAEVLRQKQLAAAMRMGVQTLKDNVMSAMAQDPTDQLAQQLQSPPPGSGGMVGGQPPAPPAPVDPMTGQPMMDPAMAGQDPNAAAAQEAPAQEGGGGGSPAGGEKKEKSEAKSEKKDSDKDEKKKEDGGKTHVEVKTGSIGARLIAGLGRK